MTIPYVRGISGVNSKDRRQQ